MKNIQKRKNGTLRVSTKNQLPSKTQQQFKDQCDVNNIMAKYKTTGVINHLNNKKALYGDFSEVSDYQTALQSVINAQNAFMNLSSDIRIRFDNNPQKLMEFLNNPRNHDEAVKLGLVEPKQSKNMGENKNETQNENVKPNKNEAQSSQS